MSAYHQMGHDSKNLLSESDLADYGGAILSPVNYDEPAIQSQIDNQRPHVDFEFVFDPQLYYPRTDRGQLSDWSYFPDDVDTADLGSDIWWDGLNDGIAAVAIRLGVDAVCSPATVPRTYSKNYYTQMVRAGNRLHAKLKPADIPALQTLVVLFDDMTDPARVMEIASIASRARSGRLFVVFVTKHEPRRELDDADSLKGALRLIHELNEAGMRVMVGFACTDVLLWKHAGARDCATGKFWNLRRFSSSRWDPASDGGGGQLPYWCEESLVAFLRESDLLRIRTLGLLSPRSLANPFGQRILHGLDQAAAKGTKPKPWVGLGWRQYMWWFMDVERTHDAGTVPVKRLLHAAEKNWETVEDNDIFMEERRNDARWVRPWRRALAEFLK